MNMSVSAGGTDAESLAYGHPYRTPWRCGPATGHSFGTLDDQLLARAELVTDMTKSGLNPFLRSDHATSGASLCQLDSGTGGGGSNQITNTASNRNLHSAHHFYTGMLSSAHHEHNGFDPSSINHNQLASSGGGPAHSQASQMQLVAAASVGGQQHPDHMTNNRGIQYPGVYGPYGPYSSSAIGGVGGCPPVVSTSGHVMSGSVTPAMSPPYASMTHVHEIDYDPRELEAFAERFKQRRIKLGVTQADVGKALGNLKLTGVGSLSQSTICRFESLTLSHNNMVALKPVLQAWLEDAERAAADRQKHPDIYDDAADKKRKRTSITDAEKRSLEAYFAIQPRPSSEKIAQISEKLNLKKNVVRVWFCNQRQKQKRMKFSTVGIGHHGS